eukprot:6684567-Prymnesium_polylepis.1
MVPSPKAESAGLAHHVPKYWACCELEVHRYVANRWWVPPMADTPSSDEREALADFLSPRSLTSTLLSQTPRSSDGLVSRTTRSLARRLGSNEPTKSNEQMLSSFAGRFDAALRNPEP